MFDKVLGMLLALIIANIVANAVFYVRNRSRPKATGFLVIAGSLMMLITLLLLQLTHRPV